MRFWDRITGGAATVTVETDKQLYMPGETISVRTTINANNEVEGKSALVSFFGQEEICYEASKYNEEGQKIGEEDEYETNQTVRAEKRIPGPIRLAEGQQHVIEAQIPVPLNAPPTYAGPPATHEYKLRVELDVAWSANSGQTVDIAVGLAGPDSGD